MIQGTTPRFDLCLPVSMSMIEELSISFIKDKQPVLEFHLSDCTVVDDNTVSVKLTQEDTRKLLGLVLVEVRARFVTGDVVGFKHLPVIVRETYNQEDL